MDNFLNNVNNFYLVVYTDEEGYELLKKYSSNKKIKFLIKNLEDFYNYKYKDYFIRNQDASILKNKVDWELNMLWSEKINFVKNTIKNKYFKTEYYGWCDIGYFRCRQNDISQDIIKYWPSHNKINVLEKDKIHYGIVNNNSQYISLMLYYLRFRNEKGIPLIPLPQEQISISGGFFVLNEDNIDWWVKTYDDMLKLYFENGYIVKDDQIVLIDCISQNMDKFYLHYENNNNYDNWFMFQRILL